MLLAAALLIASPACSRAQYRDPDRQNPNEYTDEDSQPLSIVSYGLYPIGFAAEWLVARPLHYVTAETPLAPVFSPADSAYDEAPLRMPIIPDNSLAAEPEPEEMPQEIVIRPGAPAPEHPQAPSAAGQPAAPAMPAKPAQSPGQPALQ